MTMPWSRSLVGPLRNLNVTSPSVVGFQVMVLAWPAVKLYPSAGMLKGLGCLSAVTSGVTNMNKRAGRAICIGINSK